MNEEKSILSLMVMHHALIETLFFDLREKIGSPEESESFAKYKWEVTKHFTTEEKVIFIFTKWQTPGINDLIKRLHDEHVTVLKILQDFEINLPKSKGELETLNQLMVAHRELEETDFYPKLDQELSEKEKQQIIFKVNENPVSL